MNRSLQPELLDELPASDPRAAASRRDLRRINAWMGNFSPIVRFLAPLRSIEKPIIAEIGAGEGLLGLRLAEKLPVPGRLLLVDQQPVISAETLARVRARGWGVEVIQADVFDWLERTDKIDAICASLFLHHFENEELRELLARAAEVAQLFAASEPLREPLALWLAKRLWLIGCNSVTCHDGEISVRAGFCERELSALWPKGDRRIVEKRAGFATHFFGAAPAL